MTKRRTKNRAPSPPAMAKHIQMWPVEKIKPYQNNARRHSETQIRKLCQAITEFGFTSPLLVDEHAGLLAGHGRLEAAIRLKLTEVPVIELTHLTEEKKRAFIIADNKLSDMGDWDMDMLASELAKLEKEGYDVALTAFSDAEIDSMLGEAQLDNIEETTQEVEPNIYGGATAVQRSSIPFEHWRGKGFLKGDVLDFGCGHDDYGFARYDAFSRPDALVLLRSWDVIVCNYVLNVQPADHLVLQICALINRMLRPEGVALFAIRKDVKHTTRGSRSVQLARTAEQWEEMLAQLFHVENIEHKSFHGFVCRPRHAEKMGPARRPTKRKTGKNKAATRKAGRAGR